MIFNKTLVLLILSLKIRITIQVVSDEEKSDEKNVDKTLLNRQHNDVSNNVNWQDSNFDAPNFGTRRNCMGDTFDDVLRRYRKMLQNDGALVDFVSADPLPLNATNLDLNTCAINYEEIKRIKNITITDKKIELKNKTSEENSKSEFVKKAKNLMISNETSEIEHRTPNLQNDKDNASNVTLYTDKETSYNASSKFKNGTNVKNESFESKLNITPEKSETINTATTAKQRESKKSKDHNKDKGRRVSEYQFSSIEYYDDPEDFDETLCPQDVEVITLEIDELRKYDVECEAIIEWKSLE